MKDKRGVREKRGEAKNHYSYYLGIITYRAQADREQKAQPDPPIHAGLQAEDDGDGHEEDPDVGGEVDAVRSISESNFVDAGAGGLGLGVPPALQGPAAEAERDLDGDEPGGDEDRRRDHGGPEPRRLEDPVVQRQDRELGARDRHVVEVAEDVVALFFPPMSMPTKATTTTSR